jgi:predicted DNA-binding transcriptional regulator AlpA
MEAGARAMSGDFIDIKEIAKMLSINPKSVNYVIQNNKSFPNALVLSARIRRWKRKEVEDWISSQFEKK